MNNIKRVYSRILNKYYEFRRSQFLEKNRIRIKNVSPSIISSNCNGAFILHDLGLRFNSPFVNLWIKPKDFIKLLSEFDKYMESDMIEGYESGIDYPIGQLLDIRVYFQHYKSFDEALNKWKERKVRIDKQNLFVMFTDRDGCTIEELKQFDGLNYKNKVVFVNHRIPEIKSAVYIRGYENNDSVGICTDFMPNKKYKRYLDQFDYVKWLNQGLNSVND